MRTGTERMVDSRDSANKYRSGCDQERGKEKNQDIDG